MATRPYEGNLFAYYLPTVASEDLSEVTLAELAAGVELTPGLVATGVSPNHTENMVSTPMLNGFIRQNIGTEGITFALQFVLDPDTQETADIWDNFDERAKAGVLALFPEGTPVALSRGELYPATFGRRKPIQSSQDTDQQFTVMVAVNSDYNDDAVVVETS